MVHQAIFIIVGFLAVIGLPIQGKVLPAAGSEDKELVQLVKPAYDSLPKRYLTCSYIGDPHLLPFSQPYTQYWCQKAGWELLLSNQYVTIYVLVDNTFSYFNIIDYMLIFPAPTSCSTGSPSNPSPCSGPNSPIISQAFGTNTYVHYHNSQELIIKIDKDGSYYNFYIWQSPKLVEKSCGVCVQWDCEREGLWMTPNPVIPQICNLHIDAANKRAANAVDKRIIDIATTQCINDIQSTFDVQAVKQAVTLVIQDGMKEYIEGDESLESVLEKVESLKEEVIKEAQDQSKELLAKSGSICNDQKKCLSYDVLPTAEPDARAKAK